MNRFGRFSAWLGRNVLLVDVAGTLLIAFFVVGIASYTGDTPGVLFSYDSSWQVAWSALLLVPLAFRRWRPQAAALAFAALVALHLVVGPAMLFSDAFSLLMVYSVIVYGDPRNTKPFIVLIAAFGLFASMAITWAVDVGPAFGQAWTGYREMYYGTCATVYSGGMSGDCASILMTNTAEMALMVAVTLAATIVLAYWQRARQATVRMMRERNEAIAARQDEERRIAALAERARIARDMHDVVAHTLSIIIIQSDGGRYAGANDPAVARSTMETIRHESERALHDMKRLLGVFGGSAHADYADIEALVAQARQASPDCTFRRRVAGTPLPGRLGGEASVALYRMVQEALTNVRKYAGPRVVVDIDEQWGADGVAIGIRDNGRGASSGMDGHKPGYGLLGMRERIEAVGGSVSAGPAIGGGYAVQAYVPYRAETAAGDGKHVAVAHATQSATADPASAAHRATAAEGAAADATPAAPHGTTAGMAGAPAADTTAAWRGTGGATSKVPAAAASYPATAASPVPNTSVSNAPLPNASTPVSGRSPADRPARVPAAPSATAPASATAPGSPGSTRDSSPAASAAGPGAAPDGERRRNGSQGHAGPLFALPQFQLPDHISPPSLRELAGALRSRPIDQADSAGGERFNWIERLSQWTERHYMLMDVVTAVLLILLSNTDLFASADFISDSSAGSRALEVLTDVLVLSPVALRRRFPEGCAAFLAVFCALELVFLPGVPFANMIVLYILYSASAYGRPRAWIWLGAACAVCSMLFGAKLVASTNGYVTLYAAALDAPASFDLPYVANVIVTVIIAMMVFLMCCAAIGYGRWSRARGANALILQAREEALKAEQEKQRVLAANMERDRISASIQTEVTTTLTSVIDQAAKGLGMMDDCEARGETPSPQDIVASFEAIGRQGREALAHMRQLLRVLRETGFSDDRHEGEGMRLAPAASLDDQFRAVSERAR